MSLRRYQWLVCLMWGLFWPMTLTGQKTGAMEPPPTKPATKQESTRGKDANTQGIMNKLLAPGPLMVGHKDLEHASCLQCHEAGSGVPDKLCLSCHKEIKKNVAAKKSFHGRQTKACFSCHSDHKGRNFDALKFDEKNFDHTQTGFKLSGAHAKVECRKCHTEKRTDRKVRQDETRFFGKNGATCKACHMKDDVHFFTGKAAKRDCGSCHNDVDWKKPLPFDHAKETGFRLEGKHAELTCFKCHVPNGKASARYDWPIEQKRCLSCHQDVHKTNLSPKFRNGRCDTCHNQREWKIDQFNHKVTGFELKGKHATTPCLDCHKQAPGRSSKPEHWQWTGLNTNCVSCHKDYHGFAKQTSRVVHKPLQACLRCHTESAWKSPLDFNHNKDTLYALTGKHVGVECFKCHIPKQSGAPKEPPPERFYHFPALKAKSCELCHKNPHPPAFLQRFKGLTCENCHDTSDWHSFQKMKGVFNHNTMTKFPLTGKHDQISCEKCHKVNGKDVFKFPGADKKFCVTCHNNVHEGQFSPRFAAAACSDCHNTTRFADLAAFNHNQTRFKIDGGHIKVAKDCVKCHVKTTAMLKTTPPKPAGKFQFGDPATGFCEACHNNVHEKQFNPEFAQKPCRECHSTKAFWPIKPFNHNTTRFPLRGAHVAIAKDCRQCHVRTTAMLPTEPPKPAGKFRFAGADRGFCESCHRNIHEDQFSPKFTKAACSTCHSERKFWPLLAFDHDKTDFKIRGAHETFAKNCFRCHEKTGKMLPIEPPKPAHKFKFAFEARGYCEACHKNVHEEQFSPKFAAAPCSDCHTQKSFWPLGSFNHDKTAFKLTGAHEALAKDCSKCHVKTNRTLPTTPPKPAGLYRFKGEKDGFCAACHRNEHVGQFSEKFATRPCATCHTTKVFTERKPFNHDETSYALKWKHRQVPCGECHTRTKETFKTPPGHFKGRYQFPNLARDNCLTCHKDPHRGELGTNCTSCHTEKGWPFTVNFHKDFLLSGTHLALQCRECHDNNRKLEGMSENCRMCHSKDDPHQGTLPRCGECHRQTFWNQTSFHHAMTAFPLRGMHRTLDCAACHRNGVYQGLPSTCANCHFQDALQVTTPDHKGAAFQSCESCHNEFSFRGVR